MQYPVIPPTAEPLTLQEVRIQLRQAVDDPSALENFDGDTGDDSWVLAKITAAREAAEEFLGYPLTNAVYVQTAAAFETITLPVLASEIVRIDYLDDANATQTLSTSLYYFDAFDSAVTFFLPNPPPTLSTRANAVRVYYRAGPVGPVSESIKHAMLVAITEWHLNRENSDFPESAYNLLRPKRLALGMA